jgi:Flp pilus assembly pilin Flp
MTFRTLKGLSKQRGQGMTEYIIIVAVIAVAAIGVFSYFGQTVRNQTSALATEVSGQDSATMIGNAATSASTADTKATPAKGLAKFNNNL